MQVPRLQTGQEVASTQTASIPPCAFGLSVVVESPRMIDIHFGTSAFTAARWERSFYPATRFLISILASLFTVSGLFAQREDLAGTVIVFAHNKQKLILAVDSR